MRFIDVIDVQGNKLTIDLVKFYKSKSGYFIDNNIDNTLIEPNIKCKMLFGIKSNEVDSEITYYGVVKAYNCKDDSFEDMCEWFEYLLNDVWRWSEKPYSLYGEIEETIYNNEELMRAFVKNFKGNEGYYNVRTY